MKPVHIVVLLLAGALSGALLMKVANRTKPAASAPHATVVQPPAPAPPQRQPEPAPPVAPPAPVPEETKVPAMPARREVRKPSPFRPMTPPAADPAPVERPAPPPVPEPVVPPPASIEPEHATPSAVPPAPQPHQVTLNTGLLLPVRLLDGLSSEQNVPGDRFLATLDKELVVGGFVIAERGARVEGRVVAVDRGGNVRGAAALAACLTRLHTSDGQDVAIETDSFFKHAEAAGVGGGAAAGDALLARGRLAELPPETQVTFRLKSPVLLTERLR
jgi:hypothetical protein